MPKKVEKTIWKPHFKEIRKQKYTIENAPTCLIPLVQGLEQQQFCPTWIKTQLVSRCLGCYFEKKAASRELTAFFQDPTVP